jgi:hypothetical protein
MSDEQSTCDPTEKAAGTFAQAKQRLASYPEASPQVLDKLSDKGCTDVAKRVAENNQAAPETLEKLACHDDSEVRSAVTENANASTDLLNTLAQDENPDVRFELAGNANTPVPILESLKQDENPYVVDRAEKTLNSVRSVLETADDCLMKGEFAQAEELYRKLIAGLECLIGQDHLEVAAARHKLAAALAGQDKTDEATSVEARAALTLDAIDAVAPAQPGPDPNSLAL